MFILKLYCNVIAWQVIQDRRQKHNVVGSRMVVKSMYI